MANIMEITLARKDPATHVMPSKGKFTGLLVYLVFCIIHVPLEQANLPKNKPNQTKFSIFCFVLEDINDSFLTVGKLQMPERGF